MVFSELFSNINTNSYNSHRIANCISEDLSGFVCWPGKARSFESVGAAGRRASRRYARTRNQREISASGTRMAYYTM